VPPEPINKSWRVLADSKMTEEIAYYEEELNDLVGEVQKGLDGMKRLAAAAQDEKIAVLKNRLQRAKQVLHSFRVEMRDLPRERSAAYEAKARDFQTTLQTMQAELERMREEAQRQAVGVRTVDEMSTQEVLSEAGKVQDKSIASIARMRQDISASKEVGAATAARLHEQTAQLKNINADIMRIESNLSRANLLLRAFMRKIMTDRIIMIFMLLIFIGVIVIIVYKVVDPNGNSSDNNDQVVAAVRRLDDPLIGGARRGGDLRALVAAATRLHRSRSVDALDSHP